MPVSDGIKCGGGVTSARLVRYLLMAGEHQAVAEFYDRMAPTALMEGRVMTESARAIRAGRMPEWYQSVAARDVAR